MKKLLALIYILFLGLHFAHAQDDDIFGIDSKAKSKTRKSQSNIGNVFRNAIGNFSFEVFTGGAFHTNKMVFTSLSPSLYPITQFQNIEVPQQVTAEDTLTFSGNNYAIPVNAAVKINLFNTLTLGAGYGREFGQMSNLRSGDFEFQFQQKSYTLDRAFGSIGLVLYDANKRAKFLRWRYRAFDSNNIMMQSEMNQRIRQIYPWRFTAESEFGNVYMRRNFDPSINTDNQSFYNIALRVEKEFSEYTRFFVKAGAEFRNYNYQTEINEEFQTIGQNLFFAQVGLSISLPSTKRCKVPGCGVVMKHLHNGVEYRGSSIFQLQNRRVGQWY
ncbi:hypothetical protein MMU07_15310 [Aquiflexum sp. LQ15W]|uniref:hypothetical protein n=1 Tax=Cognataquiflexum nitidum TaxID=2922272 RepID=UPI001F12B861|nr:hypothetical protein [Cognataquiflexum nitidum]MCH6200953.1 hypothetical protein [Cognataquiflexum nitidum]